MPIVPYPTFKDKVSGKEIIIGLSASGTIAKTRVYQMSTVSDPEQPTRRIKAQLQYPYVKKVQPNTEKQLAERQKMRDAVLSWQGLSPEDVAPWNEKWEKEYADRNNQPGSYKCRSGYNLYVSDYLKKH